MQSSLTGVISIFDVFHLFSLLSRVLRKIQQDQATGLLLCPYWPTQPWFPVAMRLLIDHPRVLPRKQGILHLPERPEDLNVHPLQGRLQLMTCHLSGVSSQTKEYRAKLLRSSLRHGDNPPSSSIDRTCGSERNIVVDDLPIPSTFTSSTGLPDGTATDWHWLQRDQHCKLGYCFCDWNG